MRGTLEEKVMSLQKFKVSVANAVINSENASLKTMNTDQLLYLFTPADTKKGASTSKSSENNDGLTKVPGSGKGLKSILGGLLCEDALGRNHGSKTENTHLRQCFRPSDAEQL
ncbi:hypothetical protein Tco_0738419 [Tanacetum coccineum]